MALATELTIDLLFLPYLNLIARPLRSAKRRARYGRYHASVADFRAPVDSVLGGVPTTRTV